MVAVVAAALVVFVAVFVAVVVAVVVIVDAQTSFWIVFGSNLGSIWEHFGMVF